MIGFSNFINYCGPAEYLNQVSTIVESANPGGGIVDPHLATRSFSLFYEEIKASYCNLSLQTKISRDIEHLYLVKFYKDNNIGDTQYDVKTKVKALFISVFIHLTIALHEADRSSNHITDEDTTNNDESPYFIATRTAMLKMLNNQPNDIRDASGNILPPLVPENEVEIQSFTRFYVSIKESQRWQTHAKWDKLAFYTASMATGEGILYAPNSEDTERNRMYLRRKHLFSIIERIDNPYNKCVKKRKAPAMAPVMLMPSVPGSGGISALPLWGLHPARRTDAPPSAPVITMPPLLHRDNDIRSIASPTLHHVDNNQNLLIDIAERKVKDVSSVNSDDEGIISSGSS